MAGSVYCNSISESLVLVYEMFLQYVHYMHTNVCMVRILGNWPVLYTWLCMHSVALFSGPHRFQFAASDE